MRDDFQHALTGGHCRRYPFALRRRFAFLDEESDDPRPLGHARALDKGWREASSFRYALIPRFLRSRVGRPFDGIKAEIAGAIADLRLRGLAEREVSRHVDRIPGRDRHGAPRTPGWSGAGFHVDADGILRAYGAVRPSATRATRDGLAYLCDPDRLPLTDPTAPDAAHAAIERSGGVWYLVRWARIPGMAANGASLTLRIDGRTETFHDGAPTRSQLCSRAIRRADLAGWASDAALLAGSVHGRTFDAAAKMRQESRLRAAAATHAPSNRSRRGDVAPRKT